MFLYFVQAGDAIKVGVSSDVNDRIKTIQVGNPHKVKLLHSVQVSKVEAQEIETKIHEMFHKTNLQGEWFQANQFMLEYIENIKENSLESHLSWIEEQYQNQYGEILNTLKSKIERDIIEGNLVSLDRLKSELGEVLNTVFMIPSLPVNMKEALRKWVEKREEPFTHRDIYYHFGISTRKGKKNVSIILRRLRNEGVIERSGGAGQAPIFRKL